MKRLLLLTLGAITVSFASQAQITKGTVLLGGSAEGSTYTTNGSSTKKKERGFMLSPSAGFTVRNNNVVGISITYGHSSHKISDTRLSNNLFGGDLFYRRYLPIGKNFYIFGNGGARYSYSRSKSSANAPYTSSSEAKISSLNLYPGIAYAVSKRFHLEVARNDLLSFGYTDIHYKRSTPGNPTTDDNYKSIFFQSRTDLSTNLIVGFRILLQKEPAKSQSNIPE